MVEFREIVTATDSITNNSKHWACTVGILLWLDLRFRVCLHLNFTDLLLRKKSPKMGSENLYLKCSKTMRANVS